MRQYENADELIRNVYSNQVNSPLLRLPDKVLATLMESLELESVLRLRHTSRTFMWLFGTMKTFEKHHLTEEQDKKRFTDTVRIWPAPYSFFPRQTENWLGRTCAKCSFKRKNDALGTKLLSEMPSLYCSRCRTTHTEIHFSLAQRKLPDEGERICIGQEGYFRICDDLQKTFHQLRSEYRTLDNIFLRCEFDDHEPELSCESESCRDSGVPMFSVDRGKDGSVTLYMLYFQHIKIRREPSGKICARGLRQAFDKRRPGMDSVKWLPSLFPVAGNPLRAFDPNICDCVAWYGSATEAKHIRLPLCSDSGKKWREPPGRDSYISTRARCSAYNHGFNIRHEGGSGWIEFTICPERDDVLVFVQHAWYEIDEACGPGWESIVSNTSFLKTEDKAMQGVTWCDEPQCSVSSLRQHNMHIGAVENRMTLRAKKELKLIEDNDRLRIQV